jgi:hypothetical protein
MMIIRVPELEEKEIKRVEVYSDVVLFEVSGDKMVSVHWTGQEMRVEVGSRWWEPSRRRSADPLYGGAGRPG